MREQAKARAIELKEQGHTINEIVKMLENEHFVRTCSRYRAYVGQPFGRNEVAQWVKGINNQQGRRTYREPQPEHIRKAKAAKLQKAWRERNKAYMKDYVVWYRKNFLNQKTINTPAPRIEDY